MAPGHDTNTPQAQATVASRADPTSEKDRDTANTSYIADRGNPGAAANGTRGPSSEQYHGEQIAATAPPRDPFSAGDSPSVQPNPDLRQQGNGIAPSDPGKETRATAGTSYTPSYPAGAAGQKQPTASQA